MSGFSDQIPFMHDHSDRMLNTTTTITTTNEVIQ